MDSVTANQLYKALTQLKGDNQMKSIIITLLLTCWTMAAHANATGTVSKLAVARSGYQVFVKISGTVEPVGCRTRTDWDYFIDLNVAGSKEILAALIAAKAAGQTVEIQSTTTCDTAGNGLEVVGYIIVF